MTSTATFTQQYTKATEALRRASERLKVSPFHVRVLIAIADDGGNSSVGALADELNRVRSAVYQALPVLEGRGYIERLAPNGEPAKPNKPGRIFLTDAGWTGIGRRKPFPLEDPDDPASDAT